MDWLDDQVSVDDPPVKIMNSSFKIRLCYATLVCTVLLTSSLSLLLGHVSVILLLWRRGLHQSQAYSVHHAVLNDRDVAPAFGTFQPHLFDNGPLDTKSAADANDSYSTEQEKQDAQKSFHATKLAHELERAQEPQQPVGQSIMVDVKGVDGLFLNSKVRLTGAAMAFIEETRLPLLSFQCRRMPLFDWSCVGVLSNGHFSLYTRPVLGVVSFDLFIGKEASLVSTLTEIERHFGIPRRAVVGGDAVDKPLVKWAAKQRGFKTEKGNPEEAMDLHQMVLGYLPFELKQQVVTTETEYQTIDIYDAIFPRFRSLQRYRMSLEDVNSYEAQNPDLFRPDRLIYLDGIMQSRFYGEAAYHEALVHPAMITHANPKRVAIIGGGEGATLREVLKHSTVEKVTMIDIDEGMIKISRKFIPEWSDCSMIAGSTPSCFEDQRAEIFFSDAIAWFIDNFSEKETTNLGQRYDVIIMDALDPSSVVEFSDVLYDNDILMRSIANALNFDGILVAQVGESEFADCPGDQFSKNQAEHKFTSHLKKQGFMKIEDYSEAHGGLMGVWKYKIAMKSTSSFARWHNSQAMVDLELAKRAMKSVDRTKSLFRFFDGATMMEYQYPSRVVEEVFCRNIPLPELCEKGHGWDPEFRNIHVTALEVKDSAIPNAGRGVFAKDDISEGTFIASDESVHDILMMPKTTRLVNQFRTAAVTDRWNMFDAFMFGYGFVSDFFGEPSVSIDGSIMTFLNHGCNGSYNLRMSEPYTFTEMTADPLTYPDELEYSAFETQVYNPYSRRNHLLYQHRCEIVDRDIKAGEELLDFYLNYYTEDVWERGVTELRAQCVAQARGVVISYK